MIKEKLKVMEPNYVVDTLLFRKHDQLAIFKIPLLFLIPASNISK